MTQRPSPFRNWRLELGATLTADGVCFRVWAPDCRIAVVNIHSPRQEEVPLQRREDGIWEATVAACGAGTRYSFRIDDSAALPDPVSRSQPLGVHGPSEVVDPDAFGWCDDGWQGLTMKGLTIYECHVGTATPEGTFAGLIGALPRLADLGVAAIQLMPVATFPGRRNWGYDGVQWYAASANYGGPEGLKQFVNAAHAHGLGVLLDVVYNHMGPDGNYLASFSWHYFARRHPTPWGEALNLDGKHSAEVRRFIIQNACYWLHEYRLDGLRLDATQWLVDDSDPHLLQALSTAVRASIPPQRSVVLIAETQENDARYLQPAEDGGFGFDAVWVDDFYWSLRRYATGEDMGRFQDFTGSLAEVAQTMNQGFLYEGAWSSYQGGPRGTPAREQPAWSFQYCLQHHDHVGNRPYGDRLHHVTGLDWFRVASAVLLLQTATPLIFMGQEFAASSPFLFFTDHQEHLGRRVAEGRRKECADYGFSGDDGRVCPLPDPQSEETFLRSRLRLGELESAPGRDIHRLYCELLRLRRDDAVLRAQRRDGARAEARHDDVLSIFWQHREGCRLLLANFGAARALDLRDYSDAIPPAAWQVRLATNAGCFGGDDRHCALSENGIALPKRTAVFLQAGPIPA